MELSCLPCTHLLFFGWYPQKEMFFSWKKWLHLFPYRNEGRHKMVSLQEKQTGGANAVCGGMGTKGEERHMGQEGRGLRKSPWPPGRRQL